MFKKFLKLSLVFVFSLAIFSLSIAQRQTGSLVGTVTDEEGVFLPGVLVTIKSPALILPSMSAITNERGIYRFPSLPPGTYGITYKLDGMNTLIRKDISLSVGQTVTLDVTLQLKTLEESIVVEGKAPLIDKQKASLSTNLDSEFINAIPAGRDIGSYLSMAPGMVRQEEEAHDMFWMKGTSALGGNVRENKFNLDGINLNDPLMGVQQVEIGVDIMDEVSVEAGGLTAEYGGATGAVVNVISKSGGNEFSGSATFFFRNESLQSENTKGTPLEGSKSGYKYFYEPSLTLGGPIKKDKLWFFIGASYIRRALLVPGFPWDKEEGVSPVTSNPFAFFKLSFQPNQANKFVLSYNVSNEITDHRFATQFDTEQSTHRYDLPIHAFNFHWTRFFSGNFFMDFRANYVNWEITFLPQEGETRPAISDLVSGLNTGGLGYTRNLAQKQYNIKVDGTLFADNLAGSHEFKVGAEYNSALSRDNAESVSQLFTIYTILGTPYLGMKYLDVHNKFKDQDAHFFIQDTWTVSKRLTFNLGARLSRQWVTIPKQNEDEGPQSIAGITFNRSVTEAFTATKWTNIDPRAGLIFDITGDGKTLFKASYGRFTSPLLGLLGSYGNPNSFTVAMYLLAPDMTPLFPVSVPVIPQKAKTESGSHKLSAPYTDEITVALERDIIENLSAGIRYIRRRQRNIYMAVDANSLDMDRLMNNGDLVWTNWEQVPFVDPYDGQQKFFWSQKQLLPPDFYYLNPPGAYRDFDGFEVKLTKRYSDGWFLMASYFWGHARGLMDTGYWGGEINSLYVGYYTDPNFRVNAIGRLDLDRRHQFKFQGLLQAPLGINVSGFIRYLSGNRYTRTVNSVHLGIPVAQGQAIINAEEKGSRGYPGRFTADLRLEKIFRADKVSFGVFADAFNLFNSGKAIAYNISSSNPVLTFEEMIAIENPRVLRLGARISF